MKKIIILLIALLLTINLASAIGIKWFTEQEAMDENSNLCIKYGAYNPSGKDLKAKISLEGEIAAIAQGVTFEDKIIEASTASKDAELIDFCFSVPEVYEEDCLWNGLICEQACQQEPKTYRGEVLMTEAPAQTTGGSAGSGATIAASAPLKLTVNCKAHKRDWAIVYVTLIIIVLILLLIVLYNRFKKPRAQRYKEQLKALQDKLNKEKRRK
ncbi:MAG: hypothetical protein WC471_05830 [Candidatus Woesearchaeota archaeon]